MAYQRLKPKQMAAHRERASAHRAHKVPEQPKVSTASERNMHAPLVVEMIQAGFKVLSKQRHPDKGGSHEQQVALAAARDWGISFIENPSSVNFEGEGLA